MPLWFDVINSPTLSPEQKELIVRRIGSRIGRDGVLRVISQKTRSRAANREPASNRFEKNICLHILVTQSTLPDHECSSSWQSW